MDLVRYRPINSYPFIESMLLPAFFSPAFKLVRAPGDMVLKEKDFFLRFSSAFSQERMDSNSG